MQRLTSSICCLLASIGTANAHPGHGNPATQDGFWHYATAPVHAGPILAAAVLFAIWMSNKVRRRSRAAVELSNVSE